MYHAEHYDAQLIEQGKFSRKSEFYSIGDLITVECLKNKCKYTDYAYKILDLNECKICSFKESFLKKATRFHLGRFDYSKIGNPTSSSDIITIICKICGLEYKQKIKYHLKNANDCKSKQCKVKRINSKEEYMRAVINRFIDLGVYDEYDFSKVVYVTSIQPVIVTHKKCGNTYSITAKSLLAGCECRYCRGLPMFYS